MENDVARSFGLKGRIGQPQNMWQSRWIPTLLRPVMVGIAFLIRYRWISPTVRGDLEEKSEQMKSFAVVAMRGFGLFHYPMGLGPYGRDLVRAAKREPHVANHDMCLAGWRFPLKWRRCEALETLKFGPID